ASVERMRHLSETIDNGKGTLGRLLNDEAMATDIARSMDQLAGVLAQTEARLRDAGPLLDSTTARREELAGLIEASTALIENLQGVAGDMDASQLDAVSGVLLEARSALDEAGRTLRAIRNTWPFSGNAAQTPPPEALPPQPPAD